MNALSALKTYREVGVQSAIQDASPHQLVQMLMSGAIDRMTAAIGHMQRGEIADKGRLIGAAVAIVETLRGGLNRDVGGELAANLDSLYDYMARRLFTANLRNDSAALVEVISLMKQIREAWEAIPQPQRQVDGRSGPGLALPRS
ncbi:flagellar export chaperone FliS [Thioalkalicoccus limnaeus]|uniref:Flagellar secretion chaperone FliS n=1 Tax=Thioalkalicoccus limnaeus TaxID=120681 RepID=A0ABV4BC91_9GAMM